VRKAHFNWLAAQGAEKQLKYFRQVNASKRQKLIKMELEFELLEKDSYTYGISNAACGRKHFPHCLSPLCQSSSEREAFLCPSIL
jgi:hypothetical protein